MEGHAVPLNDYKAVLRTLLTIIKGEDPDCSEFYVNISSGTPEYAAAAMLVSMQNRGFTAFTVKTKEYTQSPEEYRGSVFRDGRPQGVSSEVSEPVRVVTFDPSKQDADLITCLGIFSELRKVHARVMFEEIIDRLKVEGVWTYVPDVRKRKTDVIQKNRVQFRRQFIDPMVRKGWIVEDEDYKRIYHITAEGNAIIDVYYGIGKDDS